MVDAVDVSCSPDRPGCETEHDGCNRAGRYAAPQHARVNQIEDDTGEHGQGIERNEDAVLGSSGMPE